ncbi:hypothetical protein Y032_0023g822 [Ancylostoma ceylanicum]|uniref:C2H2-type domain-containing protein n=1 Tax=Ancylostoma ceylanicum TaxID=53326 RepID=A0A016UX57_9BILA|nr:hypothetical protein Y032_0023g822 [Ancylostoma ceylanicum]
MPYRAELKRPDLKGQFPCSVCGKIFCHSSSLSRHRMQAHFKSYTCTQCNQEISSNETLRSHMFRIHSISRMFMCRCCNWAFPDKTSLHIHMQSMLRNGTPGEVAILARSSTEGMNVPSELPTPITENFFISDGPGHSLDDSPQGSPSYSTESLLKHQFLNHNNNTGNSNNNNNAKTANNNAGINSIFPTIMKTENLLATMKKGNLLPAMDLTALSSNQWLSAWLANNPFAPNLGASQQAGSPASGEASFEVRHSELSEEVDYDALEIKMEDDDPHEEDINHDPSPTSVIVDPCCLSTRKGEDARGSQKRKATRPQQVTDAVSIEVDDKCEPPCKLALNNKELEQPSPTVSDSHTSGTSSQAGDTPAKCFDCQVVKEKLNASQSKMLEYEQKINHLEAKIVELQRSASERNHNNNQSEGFHAEGNSDQQQVVVSLWRERVASQGRKRVRLSCVSDAASPLLHHMDARASSASI